MFDLICGQSLNVKWKLLVLSKCTVVNITQWVFKCTRIIVCVLLNY